MEYKGLTRNMKNAYVARISWRSHTKQKIKKKEKGTWLSKYEKNATVVTLDVNDQEYMNFVLLLE